MHHPSKEGFEQFLRITKTSVKGKILTDTSRPDYLGSIFGPLFIHHYGDILQCLNPNRLISLFLEIKANSTPAAQSVNSYASSSATSALREYIRYFLSEGFCSSLVFRENSDICVPDIVVEQTEILLSQGQINDSDFARDAGMKINDINDIVTQRTLPIKTTLDFSFIDDVNRLMSVMSQILKRIPIVSRRKNNQDNPYADALGCYFHTGNPETNYIALYPDIILDWCVSNNHLECFIPLCIKVLIHELCHAVMDIDNYGHTDLYSARYRTYRHNFYGIGIVGLEENIDFYTVREESFANLLTIRIINELRRKPYLLELGYMAPSEINQFIRDFINTQPFHYKLSLYIDNEPHVSGWLEAKKSKSITCVEAINWMDQTSHYLDKISRLGFSNQRFSSYYDSETRISVPWAY